MRPGPAPVSPRHRAHEADRLAGVFEGFDLRYVDVAEHVRLRVRVGGEGQPVVLLHGHPRTHTTWHRVAPQLVEAGHTVVCPDLRGYGRSTSPTPRRDHSQASKREMAGDIRALMTGLGLERFSVLPWTIQGW
jgi:haloacetate dehalogenase